MFGLCMPGLLPSTVLGDGQNMNFYNLDPPNKALISPSGGHLEVSVEKKTERANGFDVIHFIIPADAENLQLDVPGRTVVRYESVPVILNSQSTHSGYREELRQKERALLASLETVKAQIEIMKAVPSQMSSQDLAQRQQLLKKEMPELALTQEKIERDLLLVRDEIQRMPQPGALGEKISVLMVENGQAPDHVKINFSYNINMCGWEAVYNFDARPDIGKDEIVDVRLLAEVWQYTGIDWNNTEITLVTRGSGPREPWPLPEWVVGAPAPKPKAVTLNAERAVATSAHADGVAGGISVKAPPMAPVHANTSDVYASWTIATKGLPEGRTRVQILADAWKAPLQWLARPSRDDNRVWLLAKYELPENQAWPAGMAQYNVNGQSVGNGRFTPRGGEATLYFGPDPRVQVRTTFDSNKQGETGIINTSKTWTWAWTFTITNSHDKPIKVRVERPAPMLRNEDISVSYQGSPKPDVNDKEHYVWWLVDVPGHGKSAIEHQVTISAPEKLSLLPDVP